jgi:hypothetical protein
MVIPNKLTAGLSVSFLFFDPDHLSDEWTASIHLRSASSKIDIDAESEGDGYRFKVSASQSASWVAEKYTAVVRLARGDEVVEVWNDRIEVYPDIAALNTYDTRTANERMLEAIRATLENRATKDQTKLSHDGKSLERTPLGDLMKLELLYQKRVASERRKSAGSGLFKINKVRMR